MTSFQTVEQQTVCCHKMSITKYNSKIRFNKVDLFRRSVTGLHGKVLGGGAAIGMASARRCEKFPPCLIQLVPAGSKRDLLLTKAQPVSHDGSTSVITHLRRGKKTAVKMAVKREE